MIKKYLQDYDYPFIFHENDKKGTMCYVEDLQKLWDWIHNEQKRILEGLIEFDIDGNKVDNNFQLGMCLAYRKILHEINGKCSKSDEEI